ncbi:hypothetical protein V6Z11_A03G013400 [Gossypium hirsutum]|nr:hypothetical protein ES288_A03G014200v1 [Gossypium darwinii]
MIQNLDIASHDGSARKLRVYKSCGLDNNKQGTTVLHSTAICNKVVGEVISKLLDGDNSRSLRLN